MDNNLQPYIVYVQTDDQNRITAINSSAFIDDTTGWIAIDEGHSGKYHHAQGNYLEFPLVDENGVFNYKLVGNVVAFLNEQEKQMELDRLSSNFNMLPTTEQRVEALEMAFLSLLEGGAM